MFVLFGMGSVGVGPAGASSHDPEDRTKTIVTINFEITDERFVIGDVDLHGSGLPDVAIDERSYTLERASLSSDGLTFDYRGTTYVVCALDIVIEDITVNVENVELSSA